MRGIVVVRRCEQCDEVLLTSLLAWVAGLRRCEFCLMAQHLHAIYTAVEARAPEAARDDAEE